MSSTLLPDDAVELLRADPGRRALLLERLHPEDLHELGDLEACEVVAKLYARLHVPAPASLVTLRTRVGGWLEALAALPRDAPLLRNRWDEVVAAGAQRAGRPPGSAEQEVVTRAVSVAKAVGD